MVRIEASSTFPIDREAGFDYITDPTNWPRFWPDLVDIPERVKDDVTFHPVMSIAEVLSLALEEKPVQSSVPV